MGFVGMSGSNQALAIREMSALSRDEIIKKHMHHLPEAVQEKTIKEWYLLIDWMKREHQN